MFCVDVAINLPVKSLFKQFTYTVTDELNFLDSGWRVVVPFGAQKVEGFVVRRRELAELTQAAQEKLKNVEAALGDRAWFDEEMLHTAKWLADYYMCSLAEAMRLFVPGKTSIKRQAVKDENGKLLYYAYEERLKEKTVLAYKITEAGRAALAVGDSRAKAQMAALAVLSDGEWFTANDLLEYKVSAATARTLVQKAWVEAGQKRILRNSYVNPQKRGELFSLTDEQAVALEKINASVLAKDGKTFLLQGITGSGKTEV